MLIYKTHNFEKMLYEKWMLLFQIIITTIRFTNVLSFHFKKLYHNIGISSVNVYQLFNTSLEFCCLGIDHKGHWPEGLILLHPNNKTRVILALLWMSSNLHTYAAYELVHIFLIQGSQRPGLWSRHGLWLAWL
jgi:hypothetical protein